MTFNKVLRLERKKKPGYSAPPPPSIFFGLARFQGLLTLSPPGAGGGSRENWAPDSGCSGGPFQSSGPPAPHASSIRLCPARRPLPAGPRSRLSQSQWPRPAQISPRAIRTGTRLRGCTRSSLQAPPWSAEQTMALGATGTSAPPPPPERSCAPLLIPLGDRLFSPPPFSLSRISSFLTNPLLFNQF